MVLDVAKIKREIHILGRYLGMRDAKPAEEDYQSFLRQLEERLVKPSMWFYPANGGMPQRAGHTPAHIRYTQLCALRAHMRGKLHFSPSTNLEEAYFILGVPCMAGPIHKTGLPQHVFKPITMEVQAEWLQPLMSEFRLAIPSGEADMAPVSIAG